jgi:type II secretory pathway pseudopilin PulG
MRKRELLFGFGAGLLVATSIVGLSASKQPPLAAAPLSQAQIKEAADALSMVVLTQDEYDQWQQEKKVDVKPAPASPKEPQAPSLGQITAPQSKPTQAPSLPTQTSVQGSTSSATAQAPTPPAVQAEKTPTKVSFTIPYGTTAEGVARILVDEGILPANNEFVSLLRSQKKLDRIRVGTYQVSSSAAEADIVKLITTSPKK